MALLRHEPVPHVRHGGPGRLREVGDDADAGGQGEAGEEGGEGVAVAAPGGDGGPDAAEDLGGRVGAPPHLHGGARGVREGGEGQQGGEAVAQARADDPAVLPGLGREEAEGGREGGREGMREM